MFWQPPVDMAGNPNGATRWVPGGLDGAYPYNLYTKKRIDDFRIPKIISFLHDSELPPLMDILDISI